MPDISMCLYAECEHKSTCYRFTAKPNPYMQSYSAFKPDANGKCDAYWNTTGDARDDDDMTGDADGE